MDTQPKYCFSCHEIRRVREIVLLPLGAVVISSASARHLKGLRKAVCVAAREAARE